MQPPRPPKTSTTKLFSTSSYKKPVRSKGAVGRWARQLTSTHSTTLLLCRVGHVCVFRM